LAWGRKVHARQDHDNCQKERIRRKLKGTRESDRGGGGKKKYSNQSSLLTSGGFGREIRPTVKQLVLGERGGALRNPKRERGEKKEECDRLVLVHAQGWGKKRE